MVNTGDWESGQSYLFEEVQLDFVHCVIRWSLVYFVRTDICWVFVILLYFIVMKKVESDKRE